MGHFVPQHRRQLVHVAIHAADQPFVYGNVIRGKACRVKFPAAVHLPAKGQGADIHRVLAARHQSRHNRIDQLFIERVLGKTVLFPIVIKRLLLIERVIPRVQHGRKIAAVHSRRAEKPHQRRQDVAAVRRRPPREHCR